MTELIEILKQDYQKFPQDQTYSIYDRDVFFQDPMTKFKGIDRYRKMIGFMNARFVDLQLDLHEISQVENTIATRWTLSWTTPLPWKPRISIPGSSELRVNDRGLIVAHIDRWDCSRLNVLQQHLFPLHKSKENDK